MDYQHPFLNILGTIDRFPLESGRQAYVSWGLTQPDIMMTIGEICRQHMNIAVFLGAERGYDYFMHVMGADVPEDATGFDFENESVEYTGLGGWDAPTGPVERYGRQEHVHC